MDVLTVCPFVRRAWFQQVRDLLTVSALGLWSSKATAGPQTPTLTELSSAPAPNQSSGEARSPLPYRPWGGSHHSAPEGLQPVDAEPPRLEGKQLARRAFELSLQGSVARKLCPTQADECRNEAGFSTRMAFLSRETPYFGWGVSLGWAEFTENLEDHEFSLELLNRGASGLLFGRLFFLPSGTFDPFIQTGFGAGKFFYHGHAKTPTRSRSVSSAIFSPIVEVSAGLDIHLTDSVKVGGVFHWTHWLLADSERCAEVAFGVCGVPGPGRLSLENAVWSLGLSTTVAFGQTL